VVSILPLSTNFTWDSKTVPTVDMCCL